MTTADIMVEPAGTAPELQWKLWIYTNYDCNLRCSYCVAKSSPNAPRRAIGLANARRLVDEAVDLGFTDIFFTGGEPFMNPHLFGMMEDCLARGFRVLVLTNAMRPMQFATTMSRLFSGSQEMTRRTLRAEVDFPPPLPVPRLADE